MLKDLENTLKSHQYQIDHLQKEVSTIKANTGAKQKLTYTTKEAAQALGVKETTIRTWIAEGKLTVTKTSKIMLIHADSLHDLIK